MDLVTKSPYSQLCPTIVPNRIGMTLTFGSFKVVLILGHFSLEVASFDFALSFGDVTISFLKPSIVVVTILYNSIDNQVVMNS